MANLRNSGSAPAITCSYLNLLGDLLSQQGITTQQWLQAAGLRDSTLDKPDSFLDLDSTIALVDSALLLSNEPALGVHYGQHLNLNAHGILGFAGLVSPTVEMSLKIGFYFVETRSPLLALSLSKSREKAIIGICLKASLPPRIELFALEAIFNSFGSMSNYLFPNQSPATEVNTTLDPPDHAHLYTDFYNGKVSFSFNQRQNLITFPADFLKKKLLSSDSQALEAVKSRMENQLKKLRHHLSQSNLLVEHLQDWLESSPGFFPSTEQIAQRLNTTPRTLHRRLKQEGSTYSDLIDFVKREKAQEYLRDSKLSVIEIAQLLSYSDSSNFARAFKKWTGLSPIEYRKNYT